MQSHICKVYECLAVTCHLRFWQNDRSLLHATVVTRGWNGYRNKSQHRKLTQEKKILLPLLDHESGALTTELSLPLRMGRRTLGERSFQFIRPVIWNSASLCQAFTFTLNSELNTHLFSSVILIILICHFLLIVLTHHQ